MTRATQNNADAPTASPPPRRRRGVWRFLFITFLLLILVLLAARLALPGWLQDYVNRTLDQSPQYDGRVGDIEVHLWRGAYAINDLDIVKTTHAVPVPFFESRRVEFTLDWNALFNGKARGKMIMHQPRLNFVHGPSDEETQTGVDQPWLSIIDELYPFRIDKAEVRDGEIHFHAFHTEPRVDVYLSEVQAAVENLTNVEDKLDPLMATVTAEGIAMGKSEGGDFEFAMSLDPQSYRPTFDLATRLIDLDATELNALTRAYGEFDFEAGRFDLVVELAVKDGFAQGYAKPLFRDAVVLGPRDFEAEDPLEAFWEALVGIVGEVFQNQQRDQFGTLITLEGKFDEPSTNLLDIIGNVLRNAFVRAYLPSFEGGAPAAPEVTNDE